MTTSAMGVSTAQLGRRAPGGGKVLRNPWGKGFENQPATWGKGFGKSQLICGMMYSCLVDVDPAHRCSDCDRSHCGAHLLVCYRCQSRLCYQTHETIGSESR